MMKFWKGNENFRPTILFVYQRKCKIWENSDFVNKIYKQKRMKKDQNEF